MSKHQKALSELIVSSEKSIQLPIKDNSITENDFRDINKIKEGEAMKWLNSFVRLIPEIPNLEISFKKLIWVKKTPKGFLASEQNKGLVEAVLEGMTGTIETLELKDCCDITLKVGTCLFFIYSCNVLRILILNLQTKIKFGVKIRISCLIRINQIIPCVK